MLKVRTESKVFTQKQMLKRDFFPPSSELALSLRNNQFSEWRNSELHSEITDSQHCHLQVTRVGKRIFIIWKSKGLSNLNYKIHLTARKHKEYKNF